MTIRQPFYIGKYLVTQEQYEVVMGKNPSRFKGAKHPVNGVSWNEAKEFCEKLGAKTGKAARLPTEAEWEYACRAGTTTPFCFGDSSQPLYAALGEYAWFDNNSGREPHPVGERKPDAWQLYDIPGNVFEWCEDDYHDNYAGAPADGRAWVDNPRKTDRVARGGYYEFTLWCCRLAFRFQAPPDFGGSGLRVVISEASSH